MYYFICAQNQTIVIECIVEVYASLDVYACIQQCIYYPSVPINVPYFRAQISSK
jgi:hypothetical protein